MLPLTSRHTVRNLTGSMRSLGRTHGVVSVPLLIIAIIAVLGHVCVLPGHVHPAPVEGHGSHDTAPVNDSAHAASCDALKSASASPLMVPVATWTSVVAVAPDSLRLPQAAFRPAHGESLPLFLLHAALLI